MKTRRILSALLAAAMTCAMCLSVGAADAPATSVDGYPINANGETYGSYLDRHKYGYAPDLIAALGDDGTEGYIRREDLPLSWRLFGGASPVSGPCGRQPRHSPV